MTHSRNAGWLRQFPLLPGEEVERLYSPREGLVEQPPESGPLLALTDRRLIAFMEQDGRREATVAALEQVGAARVKTSGRSAKPLAQGLALILVGIIAYLAIGTLLVEGLLVPALIGLAIVVVGVFFVLHYLFTEAEGSLLLQIGAWDVALPIENRKAASDAGLLIDAYFRARLGLAPVQEAVVEPLLETPSPAASPASEASAPVAAEPPPADVQPTVAAASADPSDNPEENPQQR